MYIKYIVTVLLALLMAVGAEAKGSNREKSKVYIFGMAAAFTDTIVHFTSIQEMDSAYLNKKRNFLLGRDLYSGQLREYLNGQLLMPHRTCIVLYDKKRKKLEKKYAKMMRLYTTQNKGARKFDVRNIGEQDFRFHNVDVSEETEQEEVAEVKQKPKKDKKPPKPKDNGRRPPRM